VSVHDSASARPPFNCGDQSNPTWQERAALCAELVASLGYRSSQGFSLADIGCGDQKLRDALRRRGLRCRYQGYDILPESQDVARLDVQSETLPHTYDVVVLLGVVEYLEKTEEVFASLAFKAQWVLLSHVVRQRECYTEARRAELGWRNHLTKDQITRMLEQSGLAIVRSDMTPDDRTLLVVCRSLRFTVEPAGGPATERTPSA
jgi:hypothetical protein